MTDRKEKSMSIRERFRLLGEDKVLKVALSPERQGDRAETPPVYFKLGKHGELCFRMEGSSNWYRGTVEFEAGLLFGDSICEAVPDTVLVWTEKEV